MFFSRLISTCTQTFSALVGLKEAQKEGKEEKEMQQKCHRTEEGKEDDKEWGGVAARSFSLFRSAV